MTAQTTWANIVKAQQTKPQQVEPLQETQQNKPQYEYTEDVFLKLANLASFYRGVSAQFANGIDLENEKTAIDFLKRVNEYFMASLMTKVYSQLIFQCQNCIILPTQVGYGFGIRFFNNFEIYFIASPISPKCLVESTLYYRDVQIINPTCGYEFGKKYFDKIENIIAEIWFISSFLG